MEPKLNIYNYCACFIDLLGQRNALSGQDIIPEFSTKQEREKFNQTIRESVGAIEKLQKRAASFRTGQSESSIREELNSDQKIEYDEMKKTTAKQQRWSDGLVYYTSLDTVTQKCPMNAVAEIFMLAGTLMFVGLANKQPIRGAIEVSWGVELHENELYGAVVANSYKLESEIAQYPRIVVGNITMGYLNAYLAEPVPSTPNDTLERYNRNLAQLCKSITTKDQDGHYIIDYLGQNFTDCVTSSSRQHLYELAYQFINEQYGYHHSVGDMKLSGRYSMLRQYFDENK